MTLKKSLNNKNVIRCFNIISKVDDKKYGQECGRILLEKNSDGNVAGIIKCGRCNAIYEIKDNYLILKEV